MCLLHITNIRIPNSFRLNNILILSVPLRLYFNAYIQDEKVSFFLHAHILFYCVPMAEWQMRSSAGE